MTWLNEAEIDDLKEYYKDDPVLGAAAQYLSDYRDLINSCSDGWPYWSRATRCASALSELLELADHHYRGRRHLVPANYVYPGPKEVRAAAAKIERFVRREPQLAGKEPPVLRLMLLGR
jgi:hypothetical protein